MVCGTSAGKPLLGVDPPEDVVVLRVLQVGRGADDVARRGAAAGQQLLDVEQHPADLPLDVADVHHLALGVDARRSRQIEDRPVLARDPHAAGEGRAVVPGLVQGAGVHLLDLDRPLGAERVEVHRPAPVAGIDPALDAGARRDAGHADALEEGVAHPVQVVVVALHLGEVDPGPDHVPEAHAQAPEDLLGTVEDPLHLPPVGETVPRRAAGQVVEIDVVVAAKRDTLPAAGSSRARSRTVIAAGSSAKRTLA